VSTYKLLTAHYIPACHIVCTRGVGGMSVACGACGIGHNSRVEVFNNLGEDADAMSS